MNSQFLKLLVKIVWTGLKAQSYTKNQCIYMTQFLYNVQLLEIQCFGKILRGYFNIFHIIYMSYFFRLDYGSSSIQYFQTWDPIFNSQVTVWDPLIFKHMTRSHRLKTNTCYLTNHKTNCAFETCLMFGMFRSSVNPQLCAL